MTLAAPAVLDGLITVSWWSALTGFFWASLVRVAVLHHATWSVTPIRPVRGTESNDDN